jgi:hypothetical protein
MNHRIKIELASVINLATTGAFCAVVETDSAANPLAPRSSAGAPVFGPDVAYLPDHFRDLTLKELNYTV